jgi:hypothetical protein
MRDFHGVYVPVPTPFRGDEIAVERLKSNLAKWNETPLIGYVYGEPCRAPLGTPDGDGIEEIRESLASAGLL